MRTWNALHALQSYMCTVWPLAPSYKRVQTPKTNGPETGKNIFRQRQLLIHHKLYLSVCWSYDSFVQRLTQQVTTNFKKKLETGVRQPWWEWLNLLLWSPLQKLVWGCCFLNRPRLAATMSPWQIGNGMRAAACDAYVSAIYDCQGLQHAMVNATDKKQLSACTSNSMH